MAPDTLEVGHCPDRYVLGRQSAASDIATNDERLLNRVCIGHIAHLLAW